MFSWRSSKPYNLIWDCLPRKAHRSPGAYVLAPSAANVDVYIPGMVRGESIDESGVQTEVLLSDG